MVSTVSTHYVIADTPEALHDREAFWEGIRERDPDIYRHLIHSTVGRAAHLSSRTGNKILLAGYRLAKKYYKFQ